MDHKLIVANWKSHKTVEEGTAWFEELARHLSAIDFSQKTVVVCPSFTSIAMYVPLIANSKVPILLGAQNVSAFEEGSHTGEVSAHQIQELVDYVIIGHSERRVTQHETDHDIAEKVARAHACELKTIVCIQNADTPIPTGTDYVAYEPQGAIGTGHAATLSDIEHVAKSVKEKNTEVKFLYGGSVDENNVKEFMTSSLIDGLLIGTASLEAKQFASLLQQW